MAPNVATRVGHAEVLNKTIHAVMRLALRSTRERADPQGQMGIVSRGLRQASDTAYMALIEPFRRFRVVFTQALMRQIKRAWNARSTSPDPE